MSDRIYGVDNWQINIGIVGLTFDEAMRDAIALSERSDVLCEGEC